MIRERRAFGILGVLLLLLPVACTFEQRANGEAPEEEEPPAPEVEGEASGPDTLGPTEGPLQTLRAFREAMAVGDLSLALALLDREASLMDEVAGEVGIAASRGEVLLELRARLAEGLDLSETSTHLSFPGGVALAVSTLRIHVADDVPEELEALDGRELRETVLLVATAEGWRIRHLHRSLPSPEDR